MVLCITMYVTDNCINLNFQIEVKQKYQHCQLCLIRENSYVSVFITLCDL